jgi:glycosidase
MAYEKESTHPIDGKERPADKNEFDRELFNWYKKLGRIRNSHELLRTGEYRELVSKNDLFVFGRYQNRENPMIVIINRAEEDREITLDLSRFITSPDRYENLLSGEEIKVTLENKITLEVSALSGAVLEPQ